MLTYGIILEKGNGSGKIMARGLKVVATGRWVRGFSLGWGSGGGVAVGEEKRVSRRKEAKVCLLEKTRQKREKSRVRKDAKCCKDFSETGFSWRKNRLFGHELQVFS